MSEQSTIRPLRAALMAPLVLAVLAACSKAPPAQEDVRPVRAIKLAATSTGDQALFSGDVRARHESQLGFRVNGKIIERRVEVGSQVRRGDILMRLDPQDLELAARQARASLQAAETERDLAKLDYQRHVDLHAQRFVSQAVLDARASTLKAAQARVDAARATLAGQSNQASYANLVADGDGVVTAITAESGQVVQAGTPVVRVARSGEKEVVFGVPENQVGQLPASGEVKVRLWANADQEFTGRIREVSPVADPASRTYTVKVSIPDAPEVRLGMTATVALAAGNAQPGALRVPTTALVQDKGVTSAWLIDRGAVRMVPVQVAGQAGNDVLLGGGVSAGQSVVTAGVHLLRNGQKVRILESDVARRADTAAALSAPAQQAKAPGQGK